MSGEVLGLIGIGLAVVGIVVTVVLWSLSSRQQQRHEQEMIRRDDLDKRASEAGTTEFTWREGKPVGLVHERKVVDNLALSSSVSQSK